MKHDIKQTSYMALPGLRPGVRFSLYKSIDDIIRCVSNYTGIPIKTILGKTRRRPVVESRQYICFLSRKYTSLPYEQIGNQLGGMHYTTVIYSINTVNNLCQTDGSYRSNLFTIESNLTQ